MRFSLTTHHYPLTTFLMMSPAQRRNSIIAISIGLLLVFLWLLSFLLPKPAPQVPAEQTTSPAPVQTPFTTQQLQQEKEVRVQASNVTTTAKLFTERYGSYSNEANFQNIRDLIPLMTEKFAAATVADLATKKAPMGFYGVTTRVITVDVVSQDEKQGTAVINLSTQRVEENGSAQNAQTKYQDVELMFATESGVWKVDSIKWQ